MPIVITPRVLRNWPLPEPGPNSDKETRGRVSVVGGSCEMPGALVLSAIGALRAGAGKLRIACGESIAPHVAAQIPEGRVYALPEDQQGAIAPSAAETILKLALSARSTVIGPGMVDENAVVELVNHILADVGETTLVLDAASLACLRQSSECLHGLSGNVILTPHAGEMASMLGEEKEALVQNPQETACRAADRLQAIVALKGSETFIAHPDGRVYWNRAGTVGLATSGSGDTLSGIVAGLAARGADPLQAAVWGVYLHARAGSRLVRRRSRMGFLAREILDEVPDLMGLMGRR